MARRWALVASVALMTTSLLPSPAGATPGVTATTIKIGLHAPLTGAAPVPSESIEKGKDLYFRWMRSRGRSVHGRDVQVVLRNDGYNPQQAVDACRHMVERDRVFLLIGISGADQSTACARYAASVEVPYVGPGMLKRPVEKLATYFATSMTWRAQGRLLADYLLARHQARSSKNGALAFDAPSFREPIYPYRHELESRRATLHYNRRVSRTAGSVEAGLVVDEMKEAGIQNVFVNTTPTWFIQVISQANSQNYLPLWTGIDSGAAKDLVTNAACRSGDSLDGARFLSPYPALSDSDRFDPAFRKALAKFYPNTRPDDFMWQLWAHGKVLWKMLQRSGEDLTRPRFVYRVERMDKLATGITPTLRFTPRDHFGARSTHVLRADCSPPAWRTAATFKRDF